VQTILLRTRRVHSAQNSRKVAQTWPRQLSSTNQSISLACTLHSAKLGHNYAVSPTRLLDVFSVSGGLVSKHGASMGLVLQTDIALSLYSS